MPDAGGNPEFATTRWSVVLAAQDSDAPAARDALALLCEGAWYPLYAYLRRRGHDVEAARDLTQGFFADLLERGDLLRLDRARGRFRAFLLTALKNYVANQHARANAAKRGGGRAMLSFDVAGAEDRFAREPPDPRTPETAFNAQWARELLDGVMNELEAEHAQRGKAELFACLSPCLGGAEDALPYATIAKELDAAEGAVRVAAHRLRRRFRTLLRRAIAETLSDPSEVEDEIRDLFDALAGGA